jgi:hypothetical protein
VPPEVESGLLVRLEDEAGDINFLPEITVYDSLANVVGQCEIDCFYCEHGNRFGISNLLPGTYYLRVSPYSLGQSSNWASCWYEGSRDFAHATPVRIRERGEIVPLEVRLPVGSVIRGQLHTEQPGYYGYNYGPEIFAASDTLTSLGKVPPQEILDPWQFSGVAPGEYLLSIRVRRTARYMYWWYPGTWIASEARSVVIDDWGQETSVEWNLPR